MQTDFECALTDYSDKHVISGKNGLYYVNYAIPIEIWPGGSADIASKSRISNKQVQACLAGGLITVVVSSFGALLK